MNSLSDILSDHLDTVPHVDEPADDDFLPAHPATDPTEPLLGETPPSPQAIDIGALKASIHSIKDQLDGILRALDGGVLQIRTAKEPDATHSTTGERLIEGVFNGLKMVGSDGNEYPIPPNYASKSKLVEGDLMKLTITNAGSFIFKQIGPTPRRRIVGELLCDPESGQWSVLSLGKTYKILTASVTFHHGDAGDEVVILVPEHSESEWGAVENIIHK